MLKAELYGKLSGKSPEAIRNRLEDALTSNVFGGLLYADAQGVLTRWLRGARSLTRDTLGQRPGFSVSGQLTLHFWPWLAGVEPLRHKAW